jgi:predicted nucleotidyltransferase
MPNAVVLDLDALTGFFAAEANVVCATLFGSARGGLVASGSDVNIAVLFRDPPQPQPFLDFHSRLCDAVAVTDRVDLVVLNRAHSIPAFEAISGRFLVKNDPDATAAFFSLVCREYEDAMASLESQRRLRLAMGA